MSDSQTVLITLAAAAAVIIVIIVLMAGGDFGRIGLAFRAWLTALRDPAIAPKLRALLTPSTNESGKPSGEPVRMLALLQREGRLIDFLMEDIRGATPEQIVAAVRDIHPQCQATLKKHAVLAPVLPQQEGDSVEVPIGFDPSAIRLVGNVTGEPPFKGTLQHSGWRVKELRLPPMPEGQDQLVMMPAEVELP